MTHTPMSPSSPEVSDRMSRQPRKDTKPELVLRRLLHRAGLRYRLQRRVPGMSRRTIDIAFPGPQVAVFLDGCFWHGCPEHATSPKANARWWREKLDGNMARDIETTAHLQAAGWTVLRCWEHEPPETVARQVAEVVRAHKGNHDQPMGGPESSASE
ncbi:very short patch repair endonuclease [Streptomyces sp. MST-110588]|uniref:very short patch repair endonuclease n=1 Tax=Streptomyces sp. MST-110588 TaxID=2833628 RepID=UPI001F5CCF88|nr:very short patch repair endonuclease [Streptomyces sp. MST-110588]UNO44017.1 very short patch repair endonuclease [Streptomyces sp. MST-110588]